MNPLETVLSDGECLLETSSTTPTTGLKEVLEKRLVNYYGRTGDDASVIHLQELTTSEDIQILTAKEALSIVRKVQNLLEPDTREDQVKPEEPHPVGARDLSKLRTLLSLVFKWGVEPLVRRVSLSWSTLQTTTKIEDCEMLVAFITALFFLIFPKGVEGPIAQTLLTTTILFRHSRDLLLPSIMFAWLPDILKSKSTPDIQPLQPSITRFLRILSSSQAISSLGGIIASQDIPSHVRKTCGMLLTKQLLRPDGVQGLFMAMFGEEDASGDEMKTEKLEQVARILLSVPANMNATDYYDLLIPRIFDLLIGKAPPSHRRGAAFALYRAIMAQKSSQQQQRASTTVLDRLHHPFLTFTQGPKEPGTTTFDPRMAISAIVSLISNSEPSPVFISKILSPIIRPIYLLSYDLDQIKTTDPDLRETVRGVMMSWGKIIDPHEGADILWSLLMSEKEGEWHCNLDGQLWRSQSITKTPLLSLLTPEDVRKMEQQEDGSDMEKNIFDLFPEPVHFVGLLKALDREDISSAIFVRLLEDYRHLKTRPDQDTLRILKELQIILQMQKTLTEGTTSNILRKADHLLSFVLHVLQSARTATQGSNGDEQTGTVEGLGGDISEGDSDDEDLNSEILGADDELIETCITLLLAILEASDTFPVETFPVLNNIFSALEGHAANGKPFIMPLAREARLVITARLASDFNNRREINKREESVQESYQKALKLLQDPILPVRAHGLMLLRQLVMPLALKKDDGPSTLNRALAPSILSVFLQAAQDNDSYIFLNAVQGLAAMVDTFGKEMLRGLMGEYAGGLEGLGASNVSQQDLDRRIRVGEALSYVIKRCGDALNIYTPTLLPSLFGVLRSSHLPVVLRSSAISLLGDCVDTYPLAVFPYFEDLCQAMVDLLQVETVPMIRSKDGVPRMTESDIHNNKNRAQAHLEPPAADVDTDPVTNNSKAPPLRRAALHFLALLLNSNLKQVYQGGKGTMISQKYLQRTSVTLAYVMTSDADGVVRLMARETIEKLEQLQEAMLGG